MMFWFGKPLISYQIDSLLTGGCDSVVVVTGASDSLLQPILDETESVIAVHNPQYQSGKASSVRVGASAIAHDCDAIVLLAVDQPRPAWVIRRVLDAHYDSDAIITAPRYYGHGGHPLVFSAELIEDLKSVTETRQGVREIMSARADVVNEVQFESSVVRIDVNTPQGYLDAMKDYPYLADPPRA